MQQINLAFDAKVYRLSAVKKAAYKFGDRCIASIEVVHGEIIVELKSKTAEPLAVELEGDFRNEALDQELREEIAAETERVRNLLMAEAFSSVSLIDSEGDAGDFHSDPLGIAPSSVN